MRPQIIDAWPLKCALWLFTSKSFKKGGRSQYSKSFFGSSIPVKFKKIILETGLLILIFNTRQNLPLNTIKRIQEIFVWNLTHHWSCRLKNCFGFRPAGELNARISDSWTLMQLLKPFVNHAK